MKAKTLAMLAGVTAPLILSGSTDAGFVGIETVSKPNPFGLFVVNVYAEFDAPGEDRMFAVSGTEFSPMDIRVVDGTFFQHEFGVDRPSNPALFDFFPSLRYDTFVTIGVKSFNPNDPGNPEGQPEDKMTFSAAWPGFGPSKLTSIDSPGGAFWAVLFVDAQGDPFNSDFVAGDGQVLIMQLATEDGSGFEGTMIVNYFSSNGDVHDQIVAFQHLAPDCPWDCGGDDDGNVGIVDFLELLAQWGGAGSCDFDGGGVGITDFLKLLGNWGLCP